MKPKYLLPLSHDYKRTPKDRSYNTCHFSTSVHGDQDWPRYSFPRKRVGSTGALFGLCLIVISIYIAVFEFEVLDSIYVELFLK